MNKLDEILSKIVWKAFEGGCCGFLDYRMEAKQAIIELIEGDNRR